MNNSTTITIPDFLKQKQNKRAIKKYEKMLAKQDESQEITIPEFLLNDEGFSISLWVVVAIIGVALLGICKLVFS